MKPRRTIALALAALSIVDAARAAPPTAPEQRRIFEEAGTVNGARQEDSGAVLLTLWEPHIRFRVAPQPESKLAELADIVRRASDGSRSVTISYDGAAGRVDTAAGTLDYPLCALKLDDMSFVPETPCSNGAAPAAPSGETALALALAHHGVGDMKRAQSLLQRAGTSNDPAFRKLLLRAGALVAEGVASLETPESPAADRGYVAALADYRALAALDPDDVELRFAIGAMLEELGDYSAARRLYEDILRRWPDEDYRIAVRLGALHRSEGDNEKALAQLDGLVARKGPQPGMKFHYHRGWTLTRLGRFEEAIADLSEGLTSQPDYSYAYFRRACAYAGLGRLDEAVADMERGRRLLAGFPGAGMESVQFDLRRADALIVQLKAADAARPGQAVTGTCGGYWGRGDTARSRSPLLPAN